MNATQVEACLKCACHRNGMWCPDEGQVMETHKWGGWGGWTTHSRPTYMLAGMLGVCIYFISVGWIAHSGPTYMLAGMLVVPIYLIAVGLHPWSMHIFYV